MLTMSWLSNSFQKLTISSSAALFVMVKLGGWGIYYFLWIPTNKTTNKNPIIANNNITTQAEQASRNEPAKARPVGAPSGASYLMRADLSLMPPNFTSEGKFAHIDMCERVVSGFTRYDGLFHPI